VAPAAAPAEPISEPADDAGFGDLGSEAPVDDKPFDDVPFEAGVEADEETDPKKYIEQLTGKLGQSLRKYTEEQGQPDFDLEKFAINSLLSATHTAEMDDEDRKDIIKKVNTAGDEDGNEDNSNDDNSDSNSDSDGGGFDDSDMDSGEDMGDENLQEKEEKEEGFILTNPKRLSIFAPEGSEEANFKHKIVDKLHETFKQIDEVMNEPMIEPQVKPEVAPNPNKVQPNIAPSRKNKPFLPMPSVKPDPKAKL